MTPALLTRMCRSGWRARKRFAKARTSFSEPSSSCSTSTCRFPVEARIPAATASPFGTSRAVRITWAPRPASTRAVSWPSPLDPPVISATLPLRSMPSATSLAVVSWPNVAGSRMGSSSDGVREPTSAVTPSEPSAEAGFVARDFTKVYRMSEVEVWQGET